MPTACSAYGCTYRHKKGDNIGMYCFPKDEYLRGLWTVAVRRANWKPSPSSRICGKHFQSGKPSKDKDHPDYVPNLFVFNPTKKPRDEWRKVAEEKASQRVAELLHSLPTDASGYRCLKPKLEGKSAPLIIRATENIGNQCPIRPVEPSCLFSKNMKENDNSGKRKAVEISSNDERFSTHKDIKTSVPQRVWVLNVIPAKTDSGVSIDKAIEVKTEPGSFTSVNGDISVPVPDSSTVLCQDTESLYFESSVSISDDSTLTAESSVPATEDIESSMAAIENETSLNVDTFEKVTKNTLEIPKTDPVTEDNTDSDYSDFKSTPYDTKDILAIKLETMLAVNISLQEKVKFYQNRCRLYEKEVNDLKNVIKNLKLKNPISLNN